MAVASFFVLVLVERYLKPNALKLTLSRPIQEFQILKKPEVHVIDTVLLDLKLFLPEKIRNLPDQSPKKKDGTNYS